MPTFLSSGKYKRKAKQNAKRMKIILKMLAYLAILQSDAPCANVTFSGTSSGYYFMLWKYGTVTP